MKCFALFNAVFIALALTGCASKKPAPLSYKIRSEANASLNRDASSRPLSVVLYVYQLRDRRAFSRLSFDDFVSARADADLFGEEYIRKSELVVLPGEKQDIDMQLLPDTRFLGVVAMYRMPAEQRWRYLIPADQLRETNLIGMRREGVVRLQLRDCYIVIGGVKPDLIPGQKMDGEPKCAVSPPDTVSEAAASIF
jgi:type VI secretion system protein VasD